MSQEKAVPAEQQHTSAATHSEPLEIPAANHKYLKRYLKYKNEKLVKEQFCNHCRCAGHNTSDCWHKQHYDHCGRQGHSAERCRTKVQEERRTNLLREIIRQHLPKKSSNHIIPAENSYNLSELTEEHQRAISQLQQQEQYIW